MRVLTLCLCLRALVPVVLGQERASAKFQNVTVKPGDTLWSIANAYLKDPTRWNELLRYNTLPGADPTLALPGMTLKVPAELIKEHLRAALLIHRANRVLYRRRESAEWGDATQRMQLYRDDSLRTLAASRARVQFVGGDILSLDQNSMAVIKPMDKEHDVELLRGEIAAVHAKVLTASASITPKTRGTKFSARVREDLSTRVEVYAGAAEVAGGGGKVEVRGGFVTDVVAGRTPTAPTQLPKLPEFEARLGDDGVVALRANAAPPGGHFGSAGVIAREPPRAQAMGGGGDGLQGQMRAVAIGVPVASYRIQASRSRDFERILYDRTYDADAIIDLQEAGLAPGRYWWRVSVVDLLGMEGRFSPPKEYSVGAAASRPAGGPVETFDARFEVLRPDGSQERVRVARYRIVGRADRSLTVRVMGDRVPIDEYGAFNQDVVLREGPNRIRILASDPKGNEREVVREVFYEP